jgi:hypothetical protein
MICPHASDICACVGRLGKASPLTFRLACCCLTTGGAGGAKQALFYLSSSGFKVHFANDAAGKQTLHALPLHRPVVYIFGGGEIRYLYADRNTVFASSLAPKTPI